MSHISYRSFTVLSIVLVLTSDCRCSDVSKHGDHFQARSIEQFVDKAYESIKKVIVKRSVSNGLELNKTFSLIGQPSNNNYNSIITFRFLPSSNTNQTFSLVDDISGLSVSAVTYSIPNRIPSTQLVVRNSPSINVPFFLTGAEQLIVQSNFTTGPISGQVTKFAIVYNAAQNQLISESSCIAAASFSDNVNSNSSVLLYILLGILIALLIWAIVFFVDVRRRKTKIYIEERSPNDYAFENGFLLLNNSQIKVENYSNPNEENSFLNVVIEKERRIIDHGVYQLDIINTRKTDIIITNDFKEFNKVMFQIWLNKVISKYPNLKEKTEKVKTSVFAKEEEILKRYHIINDETTKKIMAESIDVNRMNLEYLTIRQEEEKQRLLQNTNQSDRKQVEEAMVKVFAQQRHDLIIQLKIKEDLAIVKNMTVHQQVMMKEINDTYITGVRQFIEESNIEPNGSAPQTVLVEDKHQILEMYFDWYERFQIIKENEKLRQMTRLDYIYRNRTYLVTQKEIEVKNQHEIFERKSENFIETINNLEDGEEIDHMIGSSILNEFEKYKVTLYNEMEKNKTNEIIALKNKMNDNRKRKMDELTRYHDDDLNNLINSHKADESVDGLLEKVVENEKQYCSKVMSEECNIDSESTNELLKIYSEIGTKTTQKLNDKIVQLVNELQNEGIDGNIILEGYRRKMKKLTEIHESEKERQINPLKENLQKAKDNIDRNLDNKIKDTKKHYGKENNIVDELINIQVALSESDRNNILKEYNSHKLFSQNSIESFRLEQRKKMEDSRATKKAKKLKEMEERHNEKIEALYDRKLRNKSRKSEEEIKNECQSFLMLDYVRNKLEIFTLDREKYDVDELAENIHSELLAEKTAFLDEKERESVTLILREQMSKAEQTVDITDQEEKLLDIQITVLKSNPELPISPDTFILYQKTKENLQEEIIKSKFLQERAFQKNLENNRQRSLLNVNNNQQSSQLDGLIRKQKEQIFKDQVLKKEIESEHLIQTVEKDLLRKFIASANYCREDILNLILEIYPAKNNLEIDKLVEEIYSKSKEQGNQVLPKSGTSLVDAYREYTGTNNSKKKVSPNSDHKEPLKEMVKESLTSIHNNALNSFDEPDRIHDISVLEEKKENEPRKRKRKVRQKTLREDDNLSEGF